VRQLADAHGGNVRLDSVVGEGSTFTVSLPLDRDAKEREARCEEDDA
jgi:signal transduction histidine kinase